VHYDLFLRVQPKALKVMPVTGAVNAEHSGRMRQQVVSNVWDCSIFVGAKIVISAVLPPSVFEMVPHSVSLGSKMARRTTESVQADNLKPCPC